MIAIIKRELSAYFSSPIGYVYLAVMYFLSGCFLYSGVLTLDSSDLSPVFSVLQSVVMFLTPVLTMRLMSEDRRNKTDQSLLTAPLYLGTIVFGKFFAAAIVYTAGISITLVYAILLNSFAPITWAIIWGNYIALLLLGFAFISIGQLISAMTENQAIAAIGCFGAMLAILLLDVIPQMMPTSRLGMVFGQISFIRRYSIITNGVLGFSDLFFFISVAGIFIFLTTRVLEKRRWS